MIKVEIIGNVCHSPESRTTPTGKTVCQFEIAVNEKRGGEESTQYWRVSAWGKLGEVCMQYVGKGRKVYATGKPSARAYIGKDGAAKYQLEIRLDDIEFLSAGDQAKPQQAEPQQPTLAGYDDVSDSDLPF